MARAFVGTPGDVCAHWAGRFYAEDLPRKDWFAYDAAHLGAVEVNHTFYRLPSEDVVHRWRDEAPPGFAYAFKASRYLTHRQRLLTGGTYPRALDDFVDRVSLAGDALGPILFETPPNMARDDARLRAFLQRLPPRERTYVFAYRHASWYAPDVYDLLGGHGVAFCMHDWPEAPTPRDVVTAKAVSVRFHGHGRAYAGLYGSRRLPPWLTRMRRWRDAGHDVHAFFNDDENAYATRDAAWLAQKLEVGPAAPRKV